MEHISKLFLLSRRKINKGCVTVLNHANYAVNVQTLFLQPALVSK